MSWERVTDVLILSISPKDFLRVCIEESHSKLPLFPINSVGSAQCHLQTPKYNKRETSCKHQLNQRGKFQNPPDFGADTVPCANFNSHFKLQICNSTLGVTFSLTACSGCNPSAMKRGTDPGDELREALIPFQPVVLKASMGDMSKSYTLLN